MKEIRKMAAMWALITAFWGILYPEFSLIQDTFTEYQGEYHAETEFLRLLEAGGEKIRFKSKLWELLKEEKSSE